MSFQPPVGRFLGAVELTPWAGALSEWILWEVEEGGVRLWHQPAMLAKCSDCNLLWLHYAVTALWGL